MKPAPPDATVYTNIGSDKQKAAMEFDPENTTHLMDLLTDISSNAERYCIQEYAVNGLDSCIEAGTTRPVEITLPTILELKLTIQDYGLGMSLDDLIDTYRYYGKSTKRESNKVTGVLGIGSKSALAYTNQFYVTGVKDGRLTQVLVSKNEEGGGEMTVLKEEATDLPNGVKVEIPAKRNNKFAECAEDIFRYWPKGTVLIDGKEPDHIEGLALSDTILLVPKEGSHEKNVVVMGNVPYEIEDEHTPWLDRRYRGYRLVAYVELGEVAFLASRDRLKMVNKTRARLETLKEEIATGLQTAVQADVDTATLPYEALHKMVAWRNALYGQTETYGYALDNVRFRGSEFPHHLNLPYKDVNGEERLANLIHVESDNSSYGKQSSHSKQAEFPIQILTEDTLLVDGYTPDKFTAGHKKKLKKYVEQRGTKVENFILSELRIDSVYAQAQQRASWDIIKAIKIPREGGYGGGGMHKLVKGTYDVRIEGRWTEVQAEDIDATKAIYYYTPQDFRAEATYRRSQYETREEKTERNCYEAAKLMSDIDGECTIVKLGLNRVDKFTRDFPSAKNLKPSLEDHYNKLVDDLQAEAMPLEVWQTQQKLSNLAHLDATQVADPELRTAIGYATLPVDDRIKQIRGFYDSVIASYVQPKRIEWDSIPVYNLWENYPLLYGQHIKSSILDHVYVYVNEAHRYNQEEKGNDE